MDWLDRKEIEDWLLKGFFFFTLLIPVFYSPHTDVYLSAYYEGFSFSYLCLVLYMLVSGERSWKNGRRFSLPCVGGLSLIFLYNVLSLYFNYKYLHWYWEQINVTLAFLFFGFLVWSKAQVDVRALIRCIVASNLASIFCYLSGYINFFICNNKVILHELPENFYETRHYWIYSHKSEYALMLLAFIALFVAYRKTFKNRLTFCLSISILLACLYLTHSWTGIAGAVLIFAGAALDKLDWKQFRINGKMVSAIVLFLVLINTIGRKIMEERDIFTLGSRTLIWKGALEVIKKYPQGWGTRFGTSMFDPWVNNAHNVFLNHILRFSIPVGLCFTLLFLIVIAYTLIKARSFLAAGMWIAFLLLLNMDYSLMSLQMALLFLCVYLVCVKKETGKTPPANDIEKECKDASRNGL